MLTTHRAAWLRKFTRVATLPKAGWGDFGY
jgi:hypothetical protein